MKGPICNRQLGNNEEKPRAQFSDRALVLLARFLRRCSQGMQRICFSVPKLSTMEHQMKTLRHFEIASENARRKVAQIRTIIGDLDRVVQILSSDIATEEERSRIPDPSDPAYSILARTLAARRDNLKVTIATLEQRLEKILVALPEAIAA